jgi:hypothetical protein
MPRKKRITKKVLFAKTVEILKPYLTLTDWKIIVRYSSRMKAAADCDASPEYKEALIRLNTKMLPDLTYYEVVSVAVHEMIHCIVWPLAEYTEDLCKKDAQRLEMTRKLEEGLVTNLERIIMNIATELVIEHLTDDGYASIDLTPVEMTIGHDY